MQFHILTIFPEVFPAYLDASILGRARQKELITTKVWNIRDFATDKHRTTDDTPYGGGAGMVMKIEPIAKALEALKSQTPMTNDQKRKMVVLSARGEQFTQQKAAEYATIDQLVLICGRYEGIDQRVADYLADEEIAIGPYVLSGGEIAALAVIEATARLLPGVLGNEGSLVEESHSQPQTALAAGGSATQIEYPQYTKPEEYCGWKVPEVLLSGNHQAIREWRQQQSKR